MNSKWTDEELDELHSSLYSFLSFMDESALYKVSESCNSKFPTIPNNQIILGHISALKRRLDQMLEEHGGRQYPITVQNKGNV
jgi:hypothetical protein